MHPVFYAAFNFAEYFYHRMEKTKEFSSLAGSRICRILAGSAADVLGTEADSSRESTGSYFLLFLPVLIQYFSDEMLFCSRV